ncbi:hypothetical protein AN641_00470 [Candidatus Epulonipiscioides gigas]|nr:hypothetical protein AN641_00470 [Epulopiscium sp. SCG-C07WGA-EpuloA2]
MWRWALNVPLSAVWRGKGMASDPICFLKIGLMGVSAQRGHDILTKGRSPSKNNRKGEREKERLRFVS